MGADGSHNSSVPPPFLTKTYEMVDDPTTNDIVSWSENNSSFVVWNVADFTKDLLPQYFKHNNFSSFVRQLNTYGFHKIDPDRQEFANEGFAKGNKEALKNIHRRKPSASHTHPSQKDVANGCNDPAHAELEGEVQKLKEDKGILINELVKVKKGQESTEAELENLGHRLQTLEGRLQCIMTFLMRVMHNQTFAQFVQHNETLTSSKKRRIPEQGTLIGFGDSWSEEADLVRCCSGDTSVGEGMSLRSDGVSGSESSLDIVLKQFAGYTLNPSDETSPVSHSSGVAPWEIQDGSIVEHATTVDSAGNCDAKLPSEAIDCGEFRCQVSSPNDVDHKELVRENERKDNIEGGKGSGSNDVFWESMLTENPRLIDRDLEDNGCEGHNSNERWFL